MPGKKPQTAQSIQKAGRPTQRVKIVVPWEDAVKQALNKPRPAGGWPDAPKIKTKARAKK